MKSLYAALQMIAVLTTGIALAAKPPKTPDQPPLPDKAQMEALLAAHDVPGLAMAVIADCAVTSVQAFGTADLQAGTPVKPLAAFEAASLSKPVFAYLVLTLADEGVIDLDRQIARDFNYARIPDKDNYAKITPRMILTHRTGLPNWVNEAVDFHKRATRTC